MCHEPLNILQYYILLINLLFHIRQLIGFELILQLHVIKIKD